MEAVPRMPMLAFELKHSPEFIEFGPTLKQYIQEHYGEDPAHYNKSCNELEQLRQTAVHVSHDFMGCSTLKKYYSQLQFLQGRFPLTELGEAAIPFTWEDVHSGREVTLNDIKFEQACILYNIGALHSILGAMDTRQSADGMKVSCTHFQCASWAFEHLRDHFGCAGMSLDMSHELLTYQVHLMLAQAQECILEKSMADSRKSTITAKVSAQIVEFYMLSLKHLDTCNTQELISSKQYKEWKKRIDIKVLFYTCITNFYLGRQSEDQQKWGQCLAYYTLSLQKLADCQKLAKNESSDIQESLKFTNDVVGGKHQAAKKDNDFVYHEKVPDITSLPEVKGASLVKGIPFNPNDPEISGSDIFMKLVPMSAHEASSLYSEEKATLLRRIGSDIAERNDELSKYLSSLQLDQTKLNPEPERLPQQLLEKCAALSVRPNAIKDLVDSMAAVSNVSTEVDLGIKEIQQYLQEESKAELEYQDKFGKRAPNIILSEIAKECAKFETGHHKGSQSNTDLHKAMNTHINNLKLLSSPLEDLQTILPSLDKERDAESADVVKELNMLLSKVEEMRTQRESLEEQLRKDILEDDITGALCKQEGTNREVLFSEQLKKHDNQTTLIRQNLGAQANILRALTDANARYATVRKATSEIISRRDQMIRDLINSYDVYEDLMAKSQKGLDFYKKLETNVGRLLSRCRGVCKVQQEEREQMYNRFKPKVPTPSRPAAAKPGIGGIDMADFTAGVSNLDRVPQLPSGAGSHPGVSSPGPGAGTTPGGHLPPSCVPGVAGSSLPVMFDGPKLKDYLPFMKPKTFGKKDGSPPISSAHPNVQMYVHQSGSLPNSGTASPVHIAQGPGSVPASPDHFRQRVDPRLTLPDTGSPMTHPGMQDPSHGQPQQFPPKPLNMQGQRSNQGEMPQDPQFQGHMQGYDGTRGGPQSLNQGQLPHSGGIPSSYNSSPPLSSHGQSAQGHSSQGQLPAGYVQGQTNDLQDFSQDPGQQSQYVPLDQKWKKDGQPPLRQSRLPNISRPNQSQLPPAPNIHQHTVDPSNMANQPTIQGQQYINTSQGVAGQHGQFQGHVDNVPSSQMRTQTPVQVPPHTNLSNQQMSISSGMNYTHLNQQVQHSQQLPMGQGQPAIQSINTTQNSFSTTYLSSQQSQQHAPIVSQRGVTNTVSSVTTPVISPANGYTQQGPVGGQGQVGGQLHQNQPVHSVQGGYQQQTQSVVPNEQQQVQAYIPNQQVHAAGGQQFSPQIPPGQSPGQSQQVMVQPPSGQQVQQGQNWTAQAQQGLQQQQQQQQQNYTQQIQQAPHPQIQPIPGQNYGLQTGPTLAQQPSFAPTPQQPTKFQQQNVQPQPSQQPQGIASSTQPTVGQIQGQNQLGQQSLRHASPQIQQQNQQYSGGYQSLPQSSGQQLMSQQHHMTSQPSVFSQQGQGHSISQGQATISIQAPHGHQPNQGQHMMQGQQQTNQSQPGIQGQTLYQGQTGHQVQRPIQQPTPPLQQYQPNSAVNPQQPTQNIQQQQFTQNPQQGYPPSVQRPAQQLQRPVQQSTPSQQYQPNSAVNPQQPTQNLQQQQQFSQNAQQGVQRPVQQPTPPPQQYKQPPGQQFPSQQPVQPPQQFQQSAQQQLQPTMQYPPQQPTPPTNVQGQNVQGQGNFVQQASQQQPQNQQFNQQQQSYPQHSSPAHTGPAQVQAGTHYNTPPAGLQQTQIAGQQPTQVAGQQPAYNHVQPSPQQTGYGQQQTQNVAQTQQPTNQGQNVRGQTFKGQQTGTPLSGQQGQYANQVQGQTQAVGYSGQQQQPNQHYQGQGQAMTPQQQGYGQQVQRSNIPQGQVQGVATQPKAVQHMFSEGQGLLLQPKIVHSPAPVEPQGQGSSQGQQTQQPAAPTISHGSTTGVHGQQTAAYSQGQPTINRHVKPSVVDRQASHVSDSGVNIQQDQPAPVRGPLPDTPAITRSIPIDRQFSTASSLDDILSSSPDGSTERKDTVLAPKVLTAQEIQQQKEDLLKNTRSASLSKDPYKDRTKLDKFVAEVEKLAKIIEGFDKPTCSGPTPLDFIWKELMEEQDKAGRSQTLAIARCYPMKNREQDIMPYDNSRVLLTSLKDDYINASWVNDLSPACPKFIATQSPLAVTLVDFWLMLYEQGVEVLVALSGENEVGKKFPVYLPVEKGETVHHGPVTLTLQSIKHKQVWTERILHLTHHETKTGRTLIHLHYNAWPVSGFPEKKSHLLQFITEVHSFYRQQRSLMKPVVVHCSNGIGRAGMFLLTYVGVQEVNHGDGIINIQDIAGRMLWKRRSIILKKDQLKYCYESLLYYAQDVLAKQGILVHKASFGDQLPKPGVKSQSWEPGDDILFGSMSFTNLQSNIAKLGTSTKMDSSKLDKKLEMLKNGEPVTIEHESSENNDNVTGYGENDNKDSGVKQLDNLSVSSLTGSLLPDVVQGPAHSMTDKPTQQDVNVMEENSNQFIMTDLDLSEKQDKGQGGLNDLDQKMKEMMGSNSSLISNSSHSDRSKPVSITSSPAHIISREASGSPQTQKHLEIVSTSLKDLQDPNTFTIGTSKVTKQKASKADFTEERTTTLPDPNDPLSSLDPFWSVK